MKTFFYGIIATLATATSSVSQSQTIQRSVGHVSIVRDEWGVPHVYASREEDGYYGLGYALAQDRLQTLLGRYLAATSRLASVYGRDSLDKDLSKLKWAHLDLARDSYRRMPKQFQRDYASFVEGIERYVADHPAERPSWMMRLEPWIPIAWTRSWIFYWDEAVDECTAGGAPVPTDAQVTSARSMQPLAASNAWVLSPWRTADNAALLVGDSHSAFTGNGEMFEFHFDAGGITITGTAGTGTPWPIVAHTQNVAWTTTNRSYDAADCYLIETDSANPRRYRYDGKWRDMIVRSATVQVKDGASVTRSFEYTNHNGMLSPVVARKGTKAWIASSAYMDQAGMIDLQMYRRLRAKNIDDLLEIERMNETWPTNVLAADSHGNTLYLRAGRIPIRPDGFDWAKPVNGSTSATTWKGFYAAEKLVQLKNPSSGYMQNNNVAPEFMMESSPLTPDKYPADVYYDSHTNNNFRSKRAVDILSRTFAATFTDMQNLLYDEKWDQADIWPEALRRSLTRKADFVRAQSAEWRKVAQRIASFDGFASKESVGALSYLYWRRSLSENAALNREMVGLAFQDSIPGEKYDSSLTGSVGRAIHLMKAELHSTDQAFGDVHRTGRGTVSLPLGGYVGTMRAMTYGNADSLARRYVFSGQRQPLIVIFTNPIQSWSALNFGQSYRPDSPHFADQSALMSEKRLKSTWFYEADLLKHVSTKLDLDTRKH
ncbi:MAG: penicillin acylase family protein [Gemmatimonadaceae bacterium]|nr:penicillin acylase family protein [Gemmatimonadaceae bacterium]